MCTDHFRLYGIFSAGRSGSTYLRNEIVKFPGISSLDSPGYFRWIQQNLDILLNDSPGRFSLRFDYFRTQWAKECYFEHDTIYRFVKDHSLREKAMKLQKKLIIKEAFWMVGAIDEGIFLNIFPILIIRNPLAIVNSYCRPLTDKISVPFIEQNPRPDSSMTDVILDNLARFSEVRGFGWNIPSGNTLRNAPNHIKAATFVKIYFKFVLKFIEQELFENSYCLVKYEELCRKPHQELKKVSRYLGVDYVGTVKNSDVYTCERDDRGGGHIVMNRDAYKNSIFAYRENLSSREREEIWQILGPEAKKVGYACEEEF